MQFTLGKGHVSFFYNKGWYLADRYRDLTEELRRRGISYNPEAVFDKRGVYAAYPVFRGPYEPLEAAIGLIRARIAGKLAARPGWYRYYGIPMKTAK